MVVLRGPINQGLDETTGLSGDFPLNRRLKDLQWKEGKGKHRVRCYGTRREMKKKEESLYRVLRVIGD